MATPYDGKVAIWHWRGDVIAEDTIEDLVRTLKNWAPNVTQVWVKTSDGEHFQGVFDDDRNLAIDNVASVDKWVRVLEANGMEFHAWAVVKGRNVEGEADRIIEVCNRPGVKSMVLDIEPFSGFWTVGRDPIRPLMTRIRRGVGGRFHIGMAIDPRPQHKPHIFPEEWRPFINSVHLQLYWNTFERPMAEVLDEGFLTWGDYGLPVFPVLPGHAPKNEIAAGREYAIARHGAKGISWWRFGVIGPVEFPAIDKPMDDGTIDPPPVTGDGRYGIEVIVAPNSAQYRDGAHGSANVADLFQSYTSPSGYTIKYKPTAATSSSVWARWDPQLAVSGWYELSAFVPSLHATTSRARFKLHGVASTTSEIEIPLSQSNYYDLWVPLGIYQFDANNVRAGVVFMNDLTGEPNAEIAFAPLRWRQILGITPTERYLADGYDSPVGTASERASSAIWPGEWFDATGFDSLYRVGTSGEAYHTGADLNLNEPYWDADAHSPIYAAASGIVTYAARLVGWGNVIVIRHDPLLTTGQVMYARYAHVEDIKVRAGDRVVRGQQICKVGNAEGIFAYHLHFDLSPTTILETAPYDWPKLDRTQLRRDYVNPQAYLLKNRPAVR
ncbi:MAG: M23 family metallopeptidase [Anaerolineae bacterium]|nr:M23 family metallopeptidase [Anaerolineae bacterium]